MPCCATLERLLRRLEAQELDHHITSWLRTHTPLAPEEGIALDGKSVRGVPGGLHLLAAYAHQAQVVLAQEAVPHAVSCRGKSRMETAYAITSLGGMTK